MPRISYDFKQFLTGHDGYHKYFRRFKLDSSANCPNCHGIPEDPEHILFHCPRFAEDRKSLEETSEGTVTPENIIGNMFVCQEDWDAVYDMVGRSRCWLRETEGARKARLRLQSKGEGRG